MSGWTYRLHLRLNMLNNEADGHFVLSATGYNNVGVNLLWGYVEIVRRFHEAVVLTQNAHEITPTLSYISLQAASEPDVRIRVHEHFNVQQLSKPIIFNKAEDLKTFRMKTPTFRTSG